MQDLSTVEPINLSWVDRELKEGKAIEAILPPADMRIAIASPAQLILELRHPTCACKEVREMVIRYGLAILIRYTCT
jgi:hypothetical protein